MNDRSLIATDVIGTALAAICCATLLAVVLGASGLRHGWPHADYAVMPVLFFGVALVGVGLYRRRVVDGR